jgi:peptidoglycan/LPS O-acetylase OafA/YrhL
MTAVRRSDAVNGIRGIAVVAIMAHHYLPTDFFSFNVAKAFNALLITIGGYFFASAMLKEEAALSSSSMATRMGAAKRLLTRQVLRVWPLIAFVIGLYVLLAVVDGGELTKQIYHTWWMYLLEMGNVPKLIYGGQAFPAHFWTIAAQDQILVLIAGVLTVGGIPLLRRSLPWLIATGFAVRLGAILAFMPEHPAWALEMPYSVLDVACLGILARITVEDPTARGPVRRAAYTTAAITAAVWTVLPNTNASFYSLVPMALASLAVGLVLTATDPKRSEAMASGVLSNRTLVFLGTIGLSVFFLHPFVNVVIQLAWPKAFGSMIPWWLYVLIAPGIAIAGAWAMHVCLERPLMRARSRPLPKTVHEEDAKA